MVFDNAYRQGDVWVHCETCGHRHHVNARHDRVGEKSHDFRTCEYCVKRRQSEEAKR